MVKQLVAPPKRALIVDDDPYYGGELEAQVSRLWPDTAIRRVVNAAAARESLQEATFDLVICDVDLGRGEENGVGLVSSLSPARPETKFLLHSNRPLAAIESLGEIPAGVNYLPKPMSNKGLRRLVAPSQLRLLLLEDNPFVRDAWRTAFGADIALAGSEEELWTMINSGELVLDELSVIILDLDLNGRRSAGVEVLNKLTAITPVPIAACTNHVLTPEESAKFAFVLDAKDPPSAEQLVSLLSSSQS